MNHLPSPTQVEMIFDGLGQKKIKFLPQRASCFILFDTFNPQTNFSPLNDLFSTIQRGNDFQENKHPW